MFAYTHVFIYGAGLTIARARGRDAMRRTRDGVRRPWTRRCASRRNRGHGANEREAWEGAGRPAGLSFAIVIGAFVIVDLFENTMSPEPKSDPGCPRVSVRAARLLLHDPDGSELNGKYGSAFSVDLQRGSPQLRVRVDGCDQVFVFDGASVIPLSLEHFDHVVVKTRAKRVSQTAR